MIFRHWLLLAIAVWLLSGCAARSLSVLQSEFNSTVKSEHACNKTGSRTDNMACIAGFKIIYADIAAQAEKSLTKYEGSKQINVALHRLHAYALWQSGATETDVVTAARPGRIICDEENSSKMPRDCALLIMVGHFVAAEAVGRKIAAIERKLAKKDTDAATLKSRKAECIDNAKDWTKLLKRLMEDAYLPMAKDTMKLAMRSDIPVSVIKYFKNQLEKTSDELQKLNNQSILCVPKKEDFMIIKNCPCFTNGRTSSEQASCVQVMDNNVLNFTHSAYCASEDYYKSEQCPCPINDNKLACKYINKHKVSKKLYEARCKIDNALSNSL